MIDPPPMKGKGGLGMREGLDSRLYIVYIYAAL